jgi:hypothetical protein
MTKNMRIAIIGLVSICLTGCFAENIQFAEMRQHPNGMVMGKPVGYSIEEIAYRKETPLMGRDGGYLFIKSGHDRSSHGIDVTLQKQSNGPAFMGRHYFGLFGERYNTHYFGKAKNGQEKYLLIAWKNIGRCWMLVRSSQQSDGGEPSFSDAWAIFESLTVTKESNCET